MIFVDASALVAILLGENRAEEILSALSVAKDAITSPLSVYEASSAVAREMNIGQTYAHARVIRFLDKSRVRILPITENIAARASLASQRFGKGRHKAKLNMGDCFSYAIASVNEASILFTGNDFSQTDLQSALPVSH